MIKAIKKLFCSHQYIKRSRTKPFYLSIGDEVQNRKSREYYLICCKCGHKITIIKDWNTIDLESNNYFE